MPGQSRNARILALLMALGFFGTSLPSSETFAQEAGLPAAEAPTKAKRKATAKEERKPRSNRPGYYQGRKIADVMSFEGAEWLVRESRVDEEQPDKMLDALKIPRGATVADVGAGVGYNSFKMAKRVGPKGTVLATDLQPEMLSMLAENAGLEGISNVKGIRCTPTDPKLPESAVDLILMVDVYHECSNPEATLQGLRKALKPDGRLVLVEFRGEDPNVPIKEEHKMTVKQVRKELEPQGFQFKESLEFLPWQHIIIFQKGEDDPTADLPRDSLKATPTAKSAK